MEVIKSIDEVHQLISEIRNQKKGFLTNFYVDNRKHEIWIMHEDLYYERYEHSILFIRKDLSFWNLFYCSTSTDVLTEDLSNFIEHYRNEHIMSDVVGMYEQCLSIKSILEHIGFKEYTSLVRMSRLTPANSFDYSSESISRASDEEVTLVRNLLLEYFDPTSEQIPYIEELLALAHQDNVYVFKQADKVIGFIIYELSKATLYLRYWFVHPNYRDKKIGSALLHKYFYEGRETRRQLFWVIRSNKNAIKRYLHYGYKEENLYDFVFELKR